MDSRDKEFTDLFEDNTKLKSIIQEKDKQISAMETNIFRLQKGEEGINASREALAGERDLVLLLNKQIESYKGRITALSELNQELTAMNLKLQRQPGMDGGPVGNQVIKETLPELTGGPEAIGKHTYGPNLSKEVVSGSQNTVIGDTPEELVNPD